jgi:hypothetical protein
VTLVSDAQPVITVPAPTGISQPGVPWRAFSCCTGLAPAEEVPGAVEAVPLRLDPLHALRTNATNIALMARRVL